MARDSVDTVKMVEFEEDGFGESDEDADKASPPRRSVHIEKHSGRRSSGSKRHRRSTQNEEDSLLGTITERTNEESMLCSS